MPKKREHALGAVLTTALMSFLGILTETSLNVTFPTMMTEFKVGLSLIQWTTTGYLLLIAIIMLASSYLNKRFTAKQLFIAASTTFVFGSLLCLLAPSFAILLVGRLLSSFGAGLSTPLMFNLIVEIMPRKRWGFYMGLAGLIIAMAPTLGPAFGGIVNYYFSWRVIFAIVAFLALLLTIIGSRLIGQYHQPVQVDFDWTGFLLLALALVSLVLAVNQLSVAGNGLYLAGLLLLLSLALLFVFTRHAQTTKKSLLNIAVFRSPTFLLGLLAYFLLQFINIGISFVLPNYVQIVNHDNSLVAGLILLPGSIIAGLLNPFFGRLYDRFGAKLPLYLGSSCLFLACLLLTAAGLFLSDLILILLYGLLMLGHRLSFSNTLAATLKLQPANLQTDATAVFQTAQQLAGSLGTSFLAAVIAFNQEGQGSYRVLTAGGSHWAFLATTLLAGVIIVANVFLLKKAKGK